MHVLKNKKIQKEWHDKLRWTIWSWCYNYLFWVLHHLL